LHFGTGAGNGDEDMNYLKVWLAFIKFTLHATHQQLSPQFKPECNAFYDMINALVKRCVSRRNGAKMNREEKDEIPLRLVIIVINIDLMTACIFNAGVSRSFCLSLMDSGAKILRSPSLPHIIVFHFFTREVIKLLLDVQSTFHVPESYKSFNIICVIRLHSTTATL
jgi:hypothetical protein